jgi:urease accessory protein
MPPGVSQPMPLRAQLALLRLASPGLPVGAFSYSRGLEPAIAAGWVHDEASVGDFILGVLERSICPLEGALLVRLHRAWSAHDAASVRAFTLWLRAARESRELLLEDEQMGLALRRLLLNANVTTAAEAGAVPPSFTCMFALAAVRWGIAVEHALGGYFWVYCEAQTTAALRLLPLGQTAGQRLLERALPIIEACTERARTLPDHEIGNFAAGLALASAHHESQYSRLFRS